MPKKHRLRVLLPNEVVASWDSIRPLLLKSIEFCHKEFEVDDILEMVTKKSWFVIGLESDGNIVLAAACEVVQTPRRKILNVIALGGAGADIAALQFWSSIEEICRILGADSVRGAVRPSMQRYIRRLSPQTTVAYNILEKMI